MTSSLKLSPKDNVLTVTLEDEGPEAVVVKPAILFSGGTRAWPHPCYPWFQGHWPFASLTSQTASDKKIFREKSWLKKTKEKLELRFS